MTTAPPLTAADRDRAAAKDALAEPELRRYLDGYVRRRVAPADADDVIQSVLCAALEAPRVPDDREEVRKWITGIARRKLAAHYVESARELLGDPPEIAVGPAPFEASSLVRWAERQARVSEAERVDETLDWMARESDGEKLETIAHEARVPATSVRQRVSRLRRWMKARWVAELAAIVAALLALSFVAWWLWGRHVDESAEDRLRPEPSTAPSLTAQPAGSTTNVPAASVVPSAAPPPAPSPSPSPSASAVTTVVPSPKPPTWSPKTPGTSMAKPGKPTGTKSVKPGAGTGTGTGTGFTP